MERLDRFIDDAPKYKDDDTRPECEHCNTNRHVFLKKQWTLKGSKSKGLRGNAKGSDMTTYLWKCSFCGKHRRTHKRTEET